uniref:Ycf45 n=1 Tax=Schizocladia ischiensis TaxID=196139 RepID=A0A7S6ZPA4_9STRA|nr:Ycf45 [Schizocladia ischiensis]QOW07517.1 Ycf45 [Schizocladia ischiensis]
MNINSNLNQLIQIFSFQIKEIIQNHPNNNNLIEIILDVGRRPEGRFSFGPDYLAVKVISWQDLEYITKRISKFSDDNRAGIERTLHRVSCIRNRQGIIIGLTCRVGRSVVGTINIIRDLLESGNSLLVLGKPGVGKTTVIREISRVLSDEIRKRVVIVDTSNEIAGNSDVPHAGIGRARRMQVSFTQNQHDIMIEAVQNHMPEVIIVDEIGTELEALAARTIAERGVQLVGTAHGNSLDSLIKNPTLIDLIGGIQTVTLSDEEARRRKTQKSILERKTFPGFQIAIEINSTNYWVIHENVAHSIDILLANKYLPIQRRSIIEKTRIKIDYAINSSVSSFDYKSYSLLTAKNYQWNNLMKSHIPDNQRLSHLFNPTYKKKNQKIKLFLFLNLNISMVNKFKQTCESLKLTKIDIIITKDIDQANIILTSKLSIITSRKFRLIVRKKKLLIYTVNSSTIINLTKTIKHIADSYCAVILIINSKKLSY